MRPALRGALLAGGRLCALFSGLVLLACSVLASQVGEIAFESNRDGDWEIYLIDVADHATYNLTRNPADGTFRPLVRRMAAGSVLQSDREPNRQDAYIMDARTGADLRRVSSGQGIYRDPSWTADGKTLALMHGFGPAFWSMPAAARNGGLRSALPAAFARREHAALLRGSSSPVNSHISSRSTWRRTGERSDSRPDATIGMPSGRRMASGSPSSRHAGASRAST